MKQLSSKRFSEWTTYFTQWIQRRFDSLKAVVTGVKTDVAAVAGDAAAAKTSAGNVEQFFGVTLLQGYEFMTDSEVTDELEDIMQALDPDLTAEQAASITAQAMQIINPSES